MCETQIHQTHIYAEYVLDTQRILDSNTNILRIAVNVQVLITL